MDLKHFYDSRGKIECDLECLLKKMHRLKQHLADLNGHHDARSDRAGLVGLKKDVEVRYKRGKAFYKCGVSSDSTENETLKIADSNAQWIADYIRKMHQQLDGFEGEIEALKTVSPPCHPYQSADPKSRDRTDQLQAFKELHHEHIHRLESLLRVLRNRTGSVSPTALEELKDAIRPYVEENESLCCVVTDEVYSDVLGDQEADLPCSASYAEPVTVKPLSHLTRAEARSAGARSAGARSAEARSRVGPGSQDGTPSTAASHASPTKHKPKRDSGILWSTFTKSELADFKDPEAVAESTAVESSGNDGEDKHERVLCGQVDVVGVDWQPRPGSTHQVAVRSGESVVVYKCVSGWSYGLLADGRIGWFPEYCAKSSPDLLREIEGNPDIAAPTRPPKPHEPHVSSLQWTFPPQAQSRPLQLHRKDSEAACRKEGLLLTSEEGWLSDYMTDNVDAFRLDEPATLESQDANDLLIFTWSSILAKETSPTVGSFGVPTQTLASVEDVVRRALLRCQSEAAGGAMVTFLRRAQGMVEGFRL
ncbi:MAG: uncharacterized protein KVP18_003291 [Porospora cf. gigantea A]|uniref:uncharacterized protein n=1 Tax=Porospora cf. gigantea A TaxID=2853593 RepID=UPI00355A4E81|nr:MAG: hypothetical protein KVP18_003291 [Porospora cf. gigantea A]